MAFRIRSQVRNGGIRSGESSPTSGERRLPVASILWLITILLVVLWLLGYAVNIGAWINFLLIVAVILLVINLVSAAFRRPRTFD
jgi:hypothetical protein